MHVAHPALCKFGRRQIAQEIDVRAGAKRPAPFSCDDNAADIGIAVNRRAMLIQTCSMYRVNAFNLARLSNRSSATGPRRCKAHGCQPIGPLPNRESGDMIAFSATRPRPWLAATISRAGSMPGMISVATNPWPKAGSRSARSHTSCPAPVRRHAPQ